MMSDRARKGVDESLADIARMVREGRGNLPYLRAILREAQAAWRRSGSDWYSSAEYDSLRAAVLYAPLGQEWPGFHTIP